MTSIVTPGAFSSDPTNQMTIKGGRGITIWGPKTTDIHLYPSGMGGSTSGDLQFTGTSPRCYAGKDNCLITFTLHTEEDSSDPVQITMSLTNPSEATAQSICYHSGKSGDDCTQTIDVVPGNYEDVYNDTGSNKLKFTNNSNVHVWVKNLQIVRVYYMYPLDDQNSCAPEQTETPVDFITRTDYACNPEKCGGASYTGFFYDTRNGRVLQPGSTYSWGWTNPPGTFNGYNTYNGPLHCLFNFNNVTLCDNSNPPNDQNSTTDDVPFKIRVISTRGTSDWKTFYHCKTGNVTMAHSIDLATDLDLKDYYNDDPGAWNTLYLSIPDNPNPGVNLHLNDGDEEPKGRINLYRVYKTKSICNYPCQGCLGCESCYFGENCPICVGFCLTCVTPCQLCELEYDWNIMYGWNWPCTPQCETCYLPCYSCQPCETCQPCLDCQACEYSCQDYCEVNCEVCQPCENCQFGCLTCEPGCYDCQSCYNCEPSCYDFQICYLCQENCYDCQSCYQLQ